MRVGNDNSGARAPALEEADDANVVLGHDAVEDVVLVLHVRAVDGDVGVVDKLLIE